MELKKLGFNAFQKHFETLKVSQLENISIGENCAEHKESYKLFSQKTAK